MIRQHAQAYFDREANAWVVGFYETPGPPGPVGFTTYHSEAEAKSEAIEYNRRQPKEHWEYYPSHARARKRYDTVRQKRTAELVEVTGGGYGVRWWGLDL